MSVARKKLIEVALPLEAINAEGSRRKRKAPAGYPTTLHKWWAQRPVAAARAVVFSQMVDDPSAYLDVLRGDKKLLRRAESELKSRRKLWLEAKALVEKAKGSGLQTPEPGPEPTLDEVLAHQERQRLFTLIEQLVAWENTDNDRVLQSARNEIWESWRRTCAENADHRDAARLFDRFKLPAFHDPFAGSGALPMEAQRLGLETHSSDLNPVAVLITKATTEIPPKFSARPPVNPEAVRQTSQMSRQWQGTHGLADDVRYYGAWMRREALKRLEHLYPKVTISAEMARGRQDLKPYVGKELTVVAWIWARTVKSPNPAFAKCDVPLVSTFALGNLEGREAYVEPQISGDQYRFTVKIGKPKDVKAVNSGTKLERANFRCLLSGVPLSSEYIKQEGKAGRMGMRMMAIIVKGDRGRIYLSPTEEAEAIARRATPTWKPDVPICGSTQYVGVSPYGFDRFSGLFTDRQLVALATLSGLVEEAHAEVKRDALRAGLSDDETPLESGGCGAAAYADALAVYLSFVVSRVVHHSSTLCSWLIKDAAIRQVFSKQAFQMTWDFAEANVFGSSSAEWTKCCHVVADAIEMLPSMASGSARMADAAAPTSAESGLVISTDPPYYDNVPYADLSDFFYVWLRRALKPVLPHLFTTVAVPKNEELVAFAYRHGGKDGAEEFFLEGMTRAMKRLAMQSHPAFPVTIYYAFKQSESDDDEGTASTGWDTFLAAVIAAGFGISGTWPMRTEGDNRQRGVGSNALASSIIIVCRATAGAAPTATRREFLTALKAELPLALANLQRGNIAPVDLAQAAIGPGMAVYTRYAQVLDAEGKPLSVRQALALINETLDEVLAEQEGDFDSDSRWALAWFEQHGFAEGEFGVADVLARAKNTSVQGLVDAGILKSSRGDVRLLKPSELAANWDPSTDTRLSAWESVHQLIRALESGGEAAAGELVAKLGSKAELARELCYRLYTLCERKKRAAEALSYNGLVQSFPELERLAKESGRKVPAQGTMLVEDEG